MNLSPTLLLRKVRIGVRERVCSSKSTNSLILINFMVGCGLVGPSRCNYRGTLKKKMSSVIVVHSCV